MKSEEISNLIVTVSMLALIANSIWFDSKILSAIIVLVLFLNVILIFKVRKKGKGE